MSQILYSISQKPSHRLTERFGKGFDPRNLCNMRQFYLGYPNWNAVRTEFNGSQDCGANREMASLELRGASGACTIPWVMKRG